MIDTPTITGGGYLYIDQENHRYAGILQLEFKEKIALTAIGLITTRMPDGSDGFSMLISIFAEFNPGIQLGFGFTLNGVGGLLGIHRTMVTQALQKGARDGSIDAVMFPEDPLANPQKLISDLQSFFPPTEGQFIIGPMGILAWGTPPIIEAEIGLLIELPDPIRIAILGQLSMILPNREKALIKINMDILGIIDFERKLLSIDARIYDSFLLSFPLSGDMAFRLGWGSNPIFALSVGGFHPAFTPPPDFPTLRRLRVSIGDGDNPRITLDHYIAITSNTVQFGSSLDLYAKACGFKVTGHLGFDALFIFSPFSFIVDISGHVRVSGPVSLGVGLSARLSGPTPWNVSGKASFKVCFVRFSVRFDFTFGQHYKKELPGIDPSPLFIEALCDAGNWTGALPPHMQMVTSLRTTDKVSNEPAPANGALEVRPIPIPVLPMGPLELRQKVLPLEQKISQFGHHKPDKFDYFEIVSIKHLDADQALVQEDIQDYFAPAQFLELSEEEKLAAPSFDKQKAGIKIFDELDFGNFSAAKEVQYESIVINDLETGEHLELNTNRKVLDNKFKSQFPKFAQGQVFRMSAAYHSRYHQSKSRRYNPEGTSPKVIMEDSLFKVTQVESAQDGSYDLSFFDAYADKKKKTMSDHNSKVNWHIDKEFSVN